MFWLNWCVWRRDVAARRLVNHRRKRYQDARWDRREQRLEQRTERWTRLMLVQQRRLMGTDAAAD